MDRSYRIYPAEFEPNFHELEYFVPLERGREAVEAMRELMLASQPAAVFPMEVRTTAADEAYLSSNYGTPTTVISVSGMPGTDYWPYLRAVDRLLGEFGARVHWGKLHFLTPRAARRALSGERALHRPPPRARPRRRLPQRAPAAAVRLTRLGVAHAGVKRAVVGVLDAVGAQEVEVAALLGAEDVVDDRCQRRVVGGGGVKRRRDRGQHRS